MSKESALEIKDVEEFEICVCFHKNIFQSLDFTTLYLDNYLPNCRRAHSGAQLRISIEGFKTSLKNANTLFQHPLVSKYIQFLLNFFKNYGFQNPCQNLSQKIDEFSRTNRTYASYAPVTLRPPLPLSHAYMSASLFACLSSLLLSFATSKMTMTVIKLTNEPPAGWVGYHCVSAVMQEHCMVVPPRRRAE